jgi:hypothetical protein
MLHFEEKDVPIFDHCSSYLLDLSLLNCRKDIAFLDIPSGYSKTVF